MLKTNFNGWKAVFDFSFRQTVVSKSFRIITLLFCAAALFFFPIKCMISGSNNAKTDVTLLTIADDSGLGIDYSGLKNIERYNELEIKTIPFSEKDEHIKAMKEDESSSEILISISQKEFLYSFDVYSSPETKLNDSDIQTLAEDIDDYFIKEKKNKLSLTDEQKKISEHGMITEVGSIDSNGEYRIASDEDKRDFNSNIFFMCTIMIIMIFITSASNMISSSIVVEKSNNVINFIMVNVKSEALIFGKVLSAIAQSAVQIVSVSVCFVASVFIGSAVSEESKSVSEMFSEMTGNFFNDNSVNVIDILLSFVIIILGVMLFSLIAAYVGSSVSKLEEMQEGMKLYQFALLIGAYFALAICFLNFSGSSLSIDTVGMLIPLSAPFVCPYEILSGNSGGIMPFISLAVLIISDLLLFMLVARTYETRIFSVPTKKEKHIRDFRMKRKGGVH